MSDWELDERMPRFDDLHEFEVWMGGDAVRRVRRIGNRPSIFTPGTLVFTDCSHPMQNALCDESRIRGWRHLACSQTPTFAAAYPANMMAVPGEPLSHCSSAT